MRIFTSKIFFFIVLFAFFNKSFGQCTCNYSYNGTGNFTAPNNQTVCLTGTVNNLNLQNWNGNNTICVKAGCVWTQSENITFGGSSLTIEIQNGAVVALGSNPNFNTTTTFNIASGGALRLASGVNLFQGSCTINNSGTLTFESNDFQLTGTNSSITNTASGTLKHTGNGTFTLNQIKSFTNSGLVEMKSTNVTIIGSSSTIINMGTWNHNGFGKFYVNELGSFINNGILTINNEMENQGASIFKNTGSIVIQRRFYNHGAFENSGTLNMLCTNSSTVGAAYCELVLGDKGVNKMFENNNCLILNGDMTVNGLLSNNGTIDIIKPVGGTTGNLTVNKEVRGIGRVIVEDGYSALNADGKWSIAQGFWDKTGTNNGNFDANSSNTSRAQNIRIDKSANACSMVILPVTGLELQAKRISSNVVVDWKTLTEQNTLNFTVQKSKDGIQFSNVATVASAGTSNVQKNYNYTDINVQQAIAYYRVQLTDKDGKTTVSNVVAVRMGDKQAGIQVFPNPVYGQFYTSFDAAGTYNIALVDAVGKVSISKKVVATAGQTITVERPASLAKGIYILRVLNATSNSQQAFKLELK